MGSALRAAGERKENAQAARRRLRKEAALVREEMLLRLFARGLTMGQIADEMADEYGSCSVSHLYEMLPRALARLAERLDEQTVGQARALYVMRLETMLSAWMPAALGGRLDDNGVALPPDARIAELALKAADRIAEVTGGRERPKRGDINVNITLPPDVDSARAAIMAELLKERSKHEAIEGQLATVGTDLGQLTGGTPEHDEMPPPIGAVQMEIEAA
jgi:hypothetical protein